MRIRKAKYRIKFSICCVIVLFCTCGFFYSGYKILLWMIDNSNTSKIAEVASSAGDIHELTDDGEAETFGEDEPDDSPYWKFLNTSLLDVDFNQLKGINQDVVGWIKVNGTNVNYPFMQSTNNDYYLTHSLDGSYNSAGWVFADFRLKLDNTDKNTIIYAHGRLDNSMFGSLREISYNGWLNNEDNYIVRTVTEHETSLWQVFSVYHIPTTSDYIRASFKSDKDFEDFAAMLTERSAKNFGVKVNGSDRILTLSTCYSDYERSVLHARLIKRIAR